jgi:two-component system response regulator YesN
VRNRLAYITEGEGMRRVLLVDDEGYILDLLQEIIDWNFYGFQIVGKAENAKDAMQIFYREDPEIIITDICMNDISGIEFITRVRLLSSTVKIIILSAYDKFEYAQKALKLGVDGYLLKPVKKDELLSILLEVQKELENNKEYQEQIWHLQSSLDNLQRKYLEEQLTLIYQTGMEPTVTDIDMAGFWAVASIKTIERKEIVFIERDIQAFKDIKCYLLFVGDGQFAIFLHSSMQNKEQVRVVINNIKHKYCDNEKSILLAVSSSDEYSKLSKICEASRMALNMLFYMNNKYYISNVNLLKSVKSEAIEAIDREQLTLWLINNELERCREYFRSYLKRCSEANIDRAEVIRYFRQFAERIKQYIRQEDKIADFENRIEEANKAIRVNEIYDLFDYCLNLISKDSIDQKKTEVIIIKAQEYIRNNCTDENFSIDQLSEHLKISKSYLSKLYKDETGDSLWNFVIQLRMAKAKEMLMNTDFTNYEIARRIGYSSEYHFSRVFKEIVGVPPSVYKKLYIHKNNI